MSTSKSNGRRKVVLAYSGGLDTSVMLHWLKYTQGCDVVCMTADVGQGEELDGLRDKAIRSGAEAIHIVDLRETFVRDYVFPSLMANAVYEGYYLLGTSLARPPIAKALVEVAVAEGCQAISHGATGKGNDQVRFELGAYALQPSIEVIAPWRTWPYKSRSDLIVYCKQHDIPVAATAEKPYSTDRNLLHISFEGGILEDPWRAPPEDMFKLTVDPRFAPNESEDVEIAFEDGAPISINGVILGPVALLEKANAIGGKHGIGRVDIVENRYVGIKSRGVYETPGGTLLYHAHRAVESLVLDREVMSLRDGLVPQFTRMIYNGYWFSPEMAQMLAFMKNIQKGVTGVARLQLYKGGVQVTGRKARNSLYNPEYSTFEADKVYNQADADGFIKLNALRLKLNTYRDRATLADPTPEVAENVADLRANYID
ncbi:MAG: argininosuccinate synthase [Myxococcales bacterium]|nr:argininosuccinate synthase [Myxococcales bacterium]